ncbi:Piso0_005870 [Millerozyma farinosa CBS 7064]|uniref:ATPase synthesis protein 25 n=1 Tax=Pichia sorbitophila (strain ATCC MYA-4447 / BCRC 22081 / CBS 7064 / NBRC 10061 / NRRL Y-12695) TaxID=559304 RepID=G8Y352_PICSO|nr:Piso0_005870 [Millerozyma farinosa CBS 7064]
MLKSVLNASKGAKRYVAPSQGLHVSPRIEMVKILAMRRNLSTNTGRADVEETSEQRSDDSQGKDATATIPWYLREDMGSSRVQPTEKELPSIPEDAPASVESFVKLLANDYGLEDILLFDLAKLDATHEYHTDNQLAKYMIICTGKSEKHIYKAASSLRLHVKHEYGILPTMEGMSSMNLKPTARRRMMKRANKRPIATDNDYGRAANSWVMCDTMIDDIFVHMLTKERREDLNLESLWCLPEDAWKYERADKSEAESDDIFIGIRGYHTATPFSRAHCACLHTSSVQLLRHNNDISQNGEVDKRALEEQISSLKSAPTGGSVESFNERFNAYKKIHIVSPDVISFDDTVASLLSKYTSKELLLNDGMNLVSERDRDVVEIIKLLLDSPELGSKYDLDDPKEVKAYIDERFDVLAGLIDEVYRFSGKSPKLTEVPEMLPLLWRLTYYEHAASVAPNLVDRIIYDDAPFEKMSVLPSISLASNRSRDVLDLVDYYIKEESPDVKLTKSMKELILFTYGNAGKWKQFWKMWEENFHIFSSRNTDPSTSLSHWVRLVVYLTCRNDVSSMLHFLNVLLDNPSANGSLKAQLENNSYSFKSATEKKKLKESLMLMLDSISQSNPNMSSLSTVKDFALRLEE